MQIWEECYECLISALIKETRGARIATKKACDDMFTKNKGARATGLRE